MKRYTLFLLLIIAGAFLLRFYKVTQIPPSLNWDETSIGYNAYSILKTGRDEWGKYLPLHFKSYGEYKLPGQIYASIPAIALFGLNDFSVRITAVVYGTLTILFLYFLVQGLFKNRTISLLSSFLLAVSPWHVQLTRGSFESSFALMWVVLGIWFLVKGFEKHKWWIVSCFPFAMAIYTYNSARIFVPLFLITIAIIYRKQFVKYIRFSLTSTILLIVLLMPLLPFVLSGEASARYKLVSITNEAGLVPRIEERRNKSNMPWVLTNLIHNRVTYTGFYMANNYLAHFTPNFLFIKGAYHKQHHPQGIGELYWIQAPFLLYGLYLIYKRKEKYSKLLIIWLLTAIFPASLTKDIIPHALRTLNAAPVYQIISAYGFVYVLSEIKKKYSLNLYRVPLIAGICLFLFQFINYQYAFYSSYSILYSRDWQYGNKQVAHYIKDHYDSYDLIVYTREYGEPHMFTLFYLGYPPDKYQNDPHLNRFETFDWVRVLNFDKFYFPDLGDESTQVADILSENAGKKILFIGTPEEIPSSMKKLETIYFLDGSVAFEIVEN